MYRETVLDVDRVHRPCTLIVGFRLRFVHGRLLHKLFRVESLLNTPLFVGFPGFVSKLWLANDGNDRYRGVYEWDGADRAEHYARCLWRVLALVSEPDSIGYVVAPGARRDDALENPALLATPSGAPVPSWARLVAVTDPSGR